jgi:hypothetical protein
MSVKGLFIEIGEVQLDQPTHGFVKIDNNDGWSRIIRFVFHCAAPV